MAGTATAWSWQLQGRCLGNTGSTLLGWLPKLANAWSGSNLNSALVVAAAAGFSCTNTAAGSPLFCLGMMWRLGGSMQWQRNSRGSVHPGAVRRTSGDGEEGGTAAMRLLGTATEHAHGSVSSGVRWEKAAT
ncbi:hypothetical protein OEZ85_002205 [Tetradesmus obliquus]|uniref:Secreted protein n=1 Tax=Tetradesmus obliquus TaxID=3088 RepID=A0ABY8U4J3_TETOB|nr:hypothetical protein OEZ85_002205 [Tetradesmus obliquus]